MRPVVVAAGGLFAALASAACQTLASDRRPDAVFPPNARSGWPASQIARDRHLLYPGSVLCSRDLEFLGQRMALLAKTRSGTEAARRYRATAQLIAATRALFPQVTLLRFEVGGSRARFLPLHWDEQVRVTSEAQADVVVVGAELSSLCAAIAAADRGFTAAVVYAGPLGGVASDDGANLRYFDFIPPTSHPPCQRKLIRQGLHAATWVSLPPHMDSRLASFLRKEYGARIRLVHTASYDSMHVERAGKELSGILTREGVRVSGRWYLDTDPESRVAEKAGIPFDINTPHLSYGLVFDVRGLGPADWQALQSHARLSPESLMSMAGVTPAQIAGDGRASYSRRILEKRLRHDCFNESGAYRYGYEALAWGFDFWMRCRGLAEPADSGLRWVNDRRCVSGFNIAQWGRTAAFNSVSYQLPKSILQLSHNLRTDPEYKAIREAEVPALERYFRYVTGNPALTVRMPREFYVRKSTAFFQMLHPYTSEEFDAGIRGPFYTTYPMDLRDLQPRDSAGWIVVQRYMRMAKGKQFWNCRASAAQTSISNLYLVNKCAVTPAFSGGQRIEQNQINMAAAVIASLPRPDQNPIHRRVERR